MVAVIPAALCGAFAGTFGAETVRAKPDVLRSARFHFLGHFGTLTGLMGAAIAGTIVWKAEQSGAAEWTATLFSISAAGMWFGASVLLGFLCPSTGVCEKVVRYASSFLGPAACGFFAGYSLCGALEHAWEHGFLTAFGGDGFAKLGALAFVLYAFPAQISLGIQGVEKLRLDDPAAPEVRYLCFTLVDLGFSGLGYQLLVGEAAPKYWAALAVASMFLIRLLVPGLWSALGRVSSISLENIVLVPFLGALIVFLLVLSGCPRIALLILCMLKARFTFEAALMHDGVDLSTKRF